MADVRAVIGYAGPAGHRPLWPHRAGGLHPPGQAPGEVQPGLGRGHGPLAVHRPVRAAQPGHRYPGLHRRGYLPERRLQAAAGERAACRSSTRTCSPPAGSWKTRRSATWPRNTAWRWPSTWPKARSAAWPRSHAAAATENFLALEYHSVDVPWWDDIATGCPNRWSRTASSRVPDTPGLGIEIAQRRGHRRAHRTRTSPGCGSRPTSGTPSSRGTGRGHSRSKDDGLKTKRNG